MIFGGEVAEKGLLKPFPFDVFSERDDDKGHEHLLRTEDDLFVRMVRVDPERTEGVVRVSGLLFDHALFVDDDMDGLGESIYKESERKGREENEDREDKVPEDDRRDGNSDGDDAHRPEPILGSLFVLVFVGVPFDSKGLSCHAKIVAREYKKKSPSARCALGDDFFSRLLRTLLGTLREPAPFLRGELELFASEPELIVEVGDRRFAHTVEPASAA
ncbi:MAG: hypothetical protein JWN89_616 [Parcubacteria group bacterium]|nr:hypothetical protein [Parcubacteria group bacterium]